MWINIPEFTEKLEGRKYKGWNTQRHCEKADIHVTRVLDSRDKGVEDMFDEVMPEIFSEFMKDTNP